jgi:hypothetical protein
VVHQVERSFPVADGDDRAPSLPTAELRPVILEIAFSG